MIVTLPRDFLIYMDEKKIQIKIPNNSKLSKKYDFSDLAGKLSWKGNAKKEIKKLRDGWK